MTGPEQYREDGRLQTHAQELLVTSVYDAEESLQRATAAARGYVGPCHFGRGERSRSQRRTWHSRYAAWRDLAAKKLYLLQKVCKVT